VLVLIVDRRISPLGEQIRLNLFGCWFYQASL
jgi:hypothetical protein